MKIGVIGAGRIGGNAARLFVQAGHEVLLSFSRDQSRLEADAARLGERARAGTVAEAAAFGDVVLFAVPWTQIDAVLAETGPLTGKIVIDTTNQYGHQGWETLEETAAQVNQRRMPGAKLVKTFNTLTSAFQASEAGRSAASRVVLFLSGDDAEAKKVVAGLIDDAGFAAVDLGGLADAGPQEAPRREGAVYGEEYRPAEAEAAAAALRAGLPIPPTPDYTAQG